MFLVIIMDKKILKFLMIAPKLFNRLDNKISTNQVNKDGTPSMFPTFFSLSEYKDPFLMDLGSKPIYFMELDLLP